MALDISITYAKLNNPDEDVWQYLKHVELRNLCCTDLDHLRAELNLAIRRVRRKPDLVQSFFVEAGLDLWKDEPINAAIYKPVSCSITLITHLFLE